jgi:hypothetical protein
MRWFCESFERPENLPEEEGECHAKWEVAGSRFGAQFEFARAAVETEVSFFAICTFK